ncbi:MAG: SGNH/GDSL hydrolase family protein, partial [Lachnospiraceae bacterium]|nr:SGNH/GDSL hydrolase family protein [Lachnospiraceae bacterium]
MLVLIYECFGLKKKNQVDIDDNVYIKYEKNKDLVIEKSFIENIYEKHIDKVRMSKAKRIEKFIDDNAKGKIGLLDAISRNKIIKRFTDTVIVGDSIAQQVLYMIFKDEYYVKAKRGVVIPKMGEIVEEALARNPKNIIFLKGLNDAGFYVNVNEYVRNYEELINHILERRPDLNIYICSVLPPSEELLKSNGSLVDWNEQNIAVRDMCERKGI